MCQNNVFFYQRLIERTRQRRELLNQKMGKTPEAAPRKRRTPLAEDFMDNIVKQEASDAQQTSDGITFSKMCYSVVPSFCRTML